MINGEPVTSDQAEALGEEAMAALSREQQRAAAIATVVADTFKAFLNVGVFAITYAVFHDWFGIDRMWALVAAAVFTLTETRRPW